MESHTNGGGYTMWEPTIYQVQCNNSNETITLHDNGDYDRPFVMELGDWGEVGFTADELREFSKAIYNLLPSR